MSISPVGSSFLAPAVPVGSLSLPLDAAAQVGAAAQAVIFDGFNHQVEAMGQHVAVPPQPEDMLAVMRAADIDNDLPPDDSIQRAISQLGRECKNKLEAILAEFDVKIAILCSEHEAKVRQIIDQHTNLLTDRLAEMQVRHAAMLAQAQRNRESYRTQERATLNHVQDTLNTPQVMRRLVDQDPLIAQPVFVAWNQYSAEEARYQAQLQSLDQNILRLREIQDNEMAELRNAMEAALSDDLHTMELNFEREKAKVRAKSMLQVQAVQNQCSMETVALQDTLIQNLRRRRECAMEIITFQDALIEGLRRRQDAHRLFQRVEQPSVAAPLAARLGEIPEAEPGRPARVNASLAAAELPPSEAVALFNCPPLAARPGEILEAEPGRPALVNASLAAAELPPSEAVALFNCPPLAAPQPHRWRNRIFRFLGLSTR